jgi:flagellar basal body rod protein FlgC
MMQKYPMGSALTIAASGLASSAAWLDRIASAVVTADVNNPAQTQTGGVNAPPTTYQPLSVPVPDGDLATAMVDQSLALATYRANAAVMRTAEEMNKATLDMVA